MKFQSWLEVNDLHQSQFLLCFGSARERCGTPITPYYYVSYLRVKTLDVFCQNLYENLDGRRIMLQIWSHCYDGVTGNSLLFVEHSHHWMDCNIISVPVGASCFNSL